MPLRLPEHLPAIDLLKNEGIFIVDASPREARSERELRIVVLNLMPIKEVTETDFVRILSHTQLELDVSFMCVGSHIPKHTSMEHMQMFYKDFHALQDQTFDGMLITGAPVEMLPFEKVDYWAELTEIFRWADTHVRSTIYLCWAAQAALYVRHNVSKYPLAKKCFGVFRQTILRPTEPIFSGFAPTFMMPHSRHTELHKTDLLQVKALTPLAEAEETGVSLLMEGQGRSLYVMGHFEYPPSTLNTEYRRDLGKRDDVDLPRNYYEGDDPNCRFIDTWHTAATLFYNNWLNYYVAEKMVCLPEFG